MSDPRKWFEMRATSSGVGEILIYDEIGPSFWGEETVTAKDFDVAVKALGDVSEIFLRINSPGGVVYDALAIFNTLKNHAARVKARVDGLAASAASLILMAADEIIMPENAFLLIHEPRTFAWGPAASLLAAAADLETMTKTFAATYSSRSGMAEADVVALMAEDRLMNAEEAVSLGLADKKDAPAKMAANFSLAKLPSAARERLKMAFEAPEKEMTMSKAPVAAAPAPVVAKEDEKPIVAPAPAPVAAKADTIADLDAAYPALMAQARAEAANAERERILGIEEIAMAGHDALVASMKADGKTTPDQAASAILKAEKAALASQMASIKVIETETGRIYAAPVAETASAAETEASTPEQFAAEWDRNQKLRAEFASAAEYVAYKKAETAGRVRLITNRRAS